VESCIPADHGTQCLPSSAERYTPDPGTDARILAPSGLKRRLYPGSTAEAVDIQVIPASEEEKMSPPLLKMRSIPEDNATIPDTV
jgi:hypothetical protein